MPQYHKGQSGNPNGRPQGARNATTLAVEAILEGDAERLSRKAIELALDGNVIALRLCLDRIAPAPRGRSIQLDIGSAATLADLSLAQEKVLTSMADGSLTVDEAADAARVIEAVGAAHERREIERRVAALEEKENR